MGIFLKNTVQSEAKYGPFAVKEGDSNARCPEKASVKITMKSMAAMGAENQNCHRV